jgi:hypothetical protein
MDPDQDADIRTAGGGLSGILRRFGDFHQGPLACIRREKKICVGISAGKQDPDPFISHCRHLSVKSGSEPSADSGIPCFVSGR